MDGWGGRSTWRDKFLARNLLKIVTVREEKGLKTKAVGVDRSHRSTSKEAEGITGGFRG